jgi:hypothetical protein
VFDPGHGFFQQAVQIGRVVAYRDQANNGRSPHIVFIDLGDGDVELSWQAR